MPQVPGIFQKYIFCRDICGIMFRVFRLMSEYEGKPIYRSSFMHFYGKHSRSMLPICFPHRFWILYGGKNDFNQYSYLSREHIKYSYATKSSAEPFSKLSTSHLIQCHSAAGWRSNPAPATERSRHYVRQQKYISFSAF